VITSIKAYGLLAGLLVVLALGIAVKVQTSRLHGAQAHLVSLQADYDLFVAKVKKEGDLALAEAAKKEKGYADQITVATSARDAALLKLRQSAANPGRGPLSPSPSPAPGSKQVCLDPTAYAAALAGYRERLATILGRIDQLAPEGDAAQIDAQTLLKAWPASN
jgi:hypothetical protein